MNNKIIGAGLAIVVIGIGGWWFMMRPAGEPASEPAEQTNEAESIENNTTPATSGEAMTEEGVTIDITGKGFEFSQKEIRVKKDSKVKINFQSESGTHDLVIDGFNVATEQIGPGTVNTIEFVADKTGEFEYYCSVGTHRAQGMVGALIVE